MVFVPGFYERVNNPRTSFGGSENDQVMAKVFGPLPPTELNPVLEMDTHEEIINANVAPNVSVTWIDG